MKLNEFGDYASQLKRINRYLQENFGYTINMESIDSDRVNSTLKKVLARQSQIANETNVKDYHKIPEYNKTVMVAEALKILLKEIAPKRQAKEKNTIDRTFYCSQKNYQKLKKIIKKKLFAPA